MVIHTRGYIRADPFFKKLSKLLPSAVTALWREAEASQPENPARTEGKQKLGSLKPALNCER